MNWDVTIEENREIDAYDHEFSHYLVSCSESEVIGGVRLTSSIHPNLTYETFNQFFGDIRMPRCVSLLESSRFGLEVQSGMQSSNIRNATLDLFCGMLKMALSYGFENIITVVDVRMERIIGLSGWEIKRVSDLVQIGDTLTCVGVMPVDRRFIDKISSKLITK